LSDSVIYDHLAALHTVGVYPLLEDDTCDFLVAVTATFRLLYMLVVI